jgi:hypothetical protein
MVKSAAEIISQDVLNKVKIDPLKISKTLILQDINNIRSNNQLNENPDRSDPNPLPPRKESYCHAFYRILGLPVIAADKIRFYNPGYDGGDTTGDEQTRRLSIDGSQDQVLKVLEGIRENVNYENTLNFEGVETKLTYRFEMLQNPMKINMLDENKGAFDSDVQTDFVDARGIFKPARKILRPFKCVPALTNNIMPITNIIAAPFVNENSAKLRNVSLNKSYIEFVARVRFSKDIKSVTANDPLIKALQNNINTITSGYTSTKISNSFNENIQDLSILELYIVEKMLSSLFNICNKTFEEKRKALEIVARLSTQLDSESVSAQQNEIKFDTLNKWIDDRNARIDGMDLILSQIPNYTIPGVGSINNPMKSPLIASFIELVQPEIVQLRSEVDQLNSEKQKRIKLFNSINSELFYIIGEINGLGLIDIIAMMLAFWLITPEELLGLFDEPSFVRLYRDPSLHIDAVESRFQARASSITIEQSITALDKTIMSLLQISEELIEASSVTKKGA